MPEFAPMQRGPAPAALQGLAPPRRRDLRIIAALMIREMSSSYGPSAGGYLWALISPAGAILILAAALSFVVRSPALGTSFVLFYATGYLAFDIYGQLAGKIGGALRFSRALLAYPGISFLHAVIARFLLTFLTGLSVFCLVIGGILAAVETRTIIAPLPIAAGLGMAALLGLGIGLTNCLVMGLFPVWERLWPILTRPLFLASGVIFLYEDMPRAGQAVLWWNPVLHVVSMLRRGFYPRYEAAFVSPVYVCSLGLGLSVLAILLLRRYHQKTFEI